MRDSRPVRAASLLAVFLLVSAAAEAQAPRMPPVEGFGLIDEAMHGPFVVQRWVNSSSPEVSPGGMCECITVVYHGDRLVLTLGAPEQTGATTVHEATGRDINQDGWPDFIAWGWSGGAHCCFQTVAYSIGPDVERILMVDGGHCGPGELVDLDGDGIPEFVTCDDQWAYAYCSFASSPLPQVILAYDRSRGEYVPATPRFEPHLRSRIAEQLAAAQAALSQGRGRDPGEDACAVLRPALSLMYAGRFEDGVVLLRNLYQGPDRSEFERQTLDRVRSSRLYVPR